MRRYLLLSALLLWAAPAWSQAPTGVEHISSSQIRSAVAGTEGARTRLLAKMLGNRGNYTYLVLRRDETGEPEVHAEWDDVMIVQAGSAQLLHGATISGGARRRPERCAAAK